MDLLRAMPWWAVTALALLPAGAAWWTDRGLRRASPDTLPERLIQRQQRLAAISALAGVAAATAGAAGLWAIPLLWLSLQVTTHRTRRWLYGDTWSLAAQIAWNLRVLVGVFGFWWVTALTPLLLLTTQAPPWIAIAAGLLLLAWNHFHTPIVLAALRATPLERPELVDPFAAVLGRAAIPAPRLMRAGPRGALVANAFAMISTRGDVVLFLDSLLDQLAADEVTAILAHEVAHLEDFASRRTRLYAVGASLAVAVAAVTVAAQAWQWRASLTGLVFVVVTLGALVIRARRSQAREAASDRRAIALCGDGETLVRALIHLHALLRMPRRIDGDFERRATHPSLARRIQAIRAISGTAPGLTEARAFAGARGMRAVIFEPARIVFVTVDGAPAIENPAALLTSARQLNAVPYDEVVELRLDPRRNDRATLVVVDRLARRTTLELAADAVPQVQATLDQVDQLIAPAAADSRTALAVPRLIALLTALCGVAVTAWPVVVAGILGGLFPTVPLVAATAAGALLQAALLIRQSGTLPLAALLAACGLAGAWLAVRMEGRRRAARLPEPGNLATWLGAAALVGSAGVPLALLASIGYHSLWDLHVAARSLPAATVGAAALAGLLAAGPSRAARTGSVALAVLAAGTTLAGSRFFRDHLTHDALVASHAPQLVFDERTTGPAHVTRLPQAHHGVRLSPDGRHAVLSTASGAGRDSHVAYVLVDPGGWQRTVDADTVDFVDGDRVVATSWSLRTRRLRVEAIRGAGPTWTLDLDAAPSGPVDVDPVTGRWRIQPDPDDDSDERGVARLDGRIGETAVERTPLTLTRDGAYVVTSGTDAAGAGLAVAQRWRGTPLVLSLLGPNVWETRLLRTDASTPVTLAESRLRVACLGPGLTVATATCFASAIDETFVWTVDLAAGTVSATARVDEEVHPVERSADATLVRLRDGWVALWNGAPRATRLGVNGIALSYAAGRLVVLDATGTSLSWYDLPPRVTAPDRTRSARHR